MGTTPLIIDLLALRQTHIIRFPNGSEHTVEPFRGPGQALLLQFRATPPEDTLARYHIAKQLVGLAVPSATSDDLDSLAIGDWAPIIAAANGSAAQLEEVQKNGFSGDDAIPSSAAQPQP